jgi:hypothetical protein
MRCWSGGNLLVEVFFDRGDADFKLEAFVEIGREVFLDDSEIARVVTENLRVIGERGFHVRDVVFGRHLAFDVGDVIGARGEAALDGREDAVERRLALLVDPAEVGAEDQEPRRAVAYPLPARGVDRRHLGHLAMVRSSGWLYLGKGSSRHGPCRHVA